MNVHGLRPCISTTPTIRSWSTAAPSTQRYLDGQLSPEQFLPLRLQNGLYIQRFAPMLRVAIPYGTLSSRQLRRLADISQKYDKDYGHFTTRQNIQFNWPELE
ncbi:MAG: hypothetical protein ACPHCJ_11420, partial [Oceanococcaceae bacterium]